MKPPLFAWVLFTALLHGDTVAWADPRKLLNVSYDPTRELYEEINSQFNEHLATQGGWEVEIALSHGGSSKQARSVIDGLQADVVTLALESDITAIEKAGLIEPGWQKELPYNSSPYTSTIVLIVRTGNPKGIKDWNDLIRPDVKVITPNPKTSGGARWNFLAAWAYAAGEKGRDLSTDTAMNAAIQAAKDAKSFPVIDNKQSQAFIAALYQNVPVLDTGARASTVTFAQKNQGDVLIAWENEAWLMLEEFGARRFEMVYPSVSILAEPPVVMVDQYVDRKGTRKLAQAYLEFLYRPEAQETAAVLHYRPRNREVLKKYANELPPIPLVTIDETFGGWARAQDHFFGDGGVFDQLYRPGKE